MSYDDSVLRIEKAENGFEVEIYDEKMAEKNRKGKGAYEDPWKCYIFKTAEEVAKFVNEHLDSLPTPPDADEEYDDAFKQATKDEE